MDATPLPYSRYSEERMHGKIKIKLKKKTNRYTKKTTEQHTFHPENMTPEDLPVLGRHLKV